MSHNWIKCFFTLPPTGISSHGLRKHQLFHYDVGPLVGSLLLQGRSLNTESPFGSVSYVHGRTFQKYRYFKKFPLTFVNLSHCHGLSTGRGINSPTDAMSCSIKHSWFDVPSHLSKPYCHIKVQANMPDWGERGFYKLISCTWETPGTICCTFWPGLPLSILAVPAATWINCCPRLH